MDIVIVNSDETELKIGDLPEPRKYERGWNKIVKLSYKFRNSNGDWAVFDDEYMQDAAKFLLPYWYCKTGDIPMLMLCIKRDNRYRFTSIHLMLACQSCNLEIVQLVMNRMGLEKADPEKIDKLRIQYYFQRLICYANITREIYNAISPLIYNRDTGLAELAINANRFETAKILIDCLPNQPKPIHLHSNRRMCAQYLPLISEGYITFEHFHVFRSEELQYALANDWMHAGKAIEIHNIHYDNHYSVKEMLHIRNLLLAKQRKFWVSKFLNSGYTAKAVALLTDDYEPNVGWFETASRADLMIIRPYLTTACQERHADRLANLVKPPKRPS